MNCCDDFGNCVQGSDCPVHTTPQEKADVRFWAPHNAALHRAMNAPIAPPAPAAEPDENHPWDWIEDLRFWLWFAVCMAGAGGAIGWTIGPFIKQLFN